MQHVQDSRPVAFSETSFRILSRSLTSYKVQVWCPDPIWRCIPPSCGRHIHRDSRLVSDKM